MNISTIPKKLKLILSKSKLNQLGKVTDFTKIERNITTFQLVTSIICALGEKKTVYLSDILRSFNQADCSKCEVQTF